MYVCIWKQQRKFPSIEGFARIIRLGKTNVGKSTGLGDHFQVPNSKVGSGLNSSTITHFVFVFVTR